MKNNIFLPEIIKVGYRVCSDAYTRKLAYVIYYDHTGALRKKSSWTSWRDKQIPADDFTNEPTEGFVLNKKADRNWYGRNQSQAYQTYVRVYDPRGFDFDITIPNLLYILEKTNSIVGKGLEGKFVYGWAGTELLLMPTGTKEYEELSKFQEAMFHPEPLKDNDLVSGRTYLTDKNQNYVYLGTYDIYKNQELEDDFGKQDGKDFYFWNKDEDCLIKLKAINKKIIKAVDDNQDINYDYYIERAQSSLIFSPIDFEVIKIIPYTKKEFMEMLEEKEAEIDKSVSYLKWNVSIGCLNTKHNYYQNATLKLLGTDLILYFKLSKNDNKTIIINNTAYHMESSNKSESLTLDELFEKYIPCKKVIYLQNGSIHRVV